VEPDQQNIAVARDLSLAAAAGLWKLTEDAFDLVQRLQKGDLSHGDTHLHNFIVSPSPLEVVPIDFEMARTREDCAPDAWEARCESERMHLLKFAIFLQSALGRGRGELAERSMEAIDQLVEKPKPFIKAIDERTFDAQAHAKN
jgi:tRNA A-37 threonylcarbamoyl transferase component Bud32